MAFKIKEYRCKKCKQVFEFTHTGDDKAVCGCGSKRLERILSVGGYSIQGDNSASTAPKFRGKK